MGKEQCGVLLLCDIEFTMGLAVAAFDACPCSLSVLCFLCHPPISVELESDAAGGRDAAHSPPASASPQILLVDLVRKRFGSGMGEAIGARRRMRLDQ